MSTILVLKHLRKSTKCSLSVNTFGRIFKYYPNLVPATRGLATNTNISAPYPISTGNDQWRIIYRLPMISVASAINGFKIPYGVINGIAVPASFALELSSLVPPYTAASVCAVGITSWLTLAIVSFFIRNLIGIIYVNDSNDKLKFAYVDFWGKRNDVCVELDDVISEREKSKPLTIKFYQSLCLYSNEKLKYKLLQKFCQIEDPETFASIFGEYE